MTYKKEISEDRQTFSVRLKSGKTAVLPTDPTKLTVYELCRQFEINTTARAAMKRILKSYPISVRAFSHISADEFASMPTIRGGSVRSVVAAMSEVIAIYDHPPEFSDHFVTTGQAHEWARDPDEKRIEKAIKLLEIKGYKVKPPSEGLAA